MHLNKLLLLLLLLADSVIFQAVFNRRSVAPSYKHFPITSQFHRVFVVLEGSRKRSGIITY